MDDNRAEEPGVPGEFSWLRGLLHASGAFMVAPLIVIVLQAGGVLAPSNEVAQVAGSLAGKCFFYALAVSYLFQTGKWIAGWLALFGCLVSVGFGVSLGAVDQARTKPVEAPALTPVTEAEAATFGERLSAAVRAGDADAIEACIDVGALVRHGLAGLELSATHLEKATAGAMNGARTTGIVHELARATATGGSLEKLAVRERAGIRRVTFRLLNANAGVEHLTFLLSHRLAGQVVAVDVHLLSTGELLSETVRRVLLPVISRDGTLLRRLRPIDSALLRNWRLVRQAQEKLASDRAAEAVGLLEALPESVRSQKFVVLQLVRATSQAGDDDRYEHALADFIRRFPDDAASSMVAIDYHYLRKDYEKAAADIKRVQTITVPDPYLDVLLANALLEFGHADEAVTVAERAVEREPDLRPAHTALVMASFRAKDFATARRALLRGREQFGGFFDIETLPEFAQFMKSPEGAAFRRQARK